MRTARTQANLYAAVILGLALAAGAARAASLTWDANGSTAPNPDGGTGTWDVNTTSNWWDGVNNARWPALGGADDDAVFGNTSGTVSLAAGGVTANDLTFNANGYLIQGNTLTLNGTTPTLTLGAGVTGTIGSAVAGAGGLTKAGDGTLFLTNANSYSGGTVVNGGVLSVNADNRLGAVPGAFSATNIILDGGAIRVTGNNIQFGANRGVTLKAGGGGLIPASGNSGFLGVITGPGALTVRGGGGQYITGTGANGRHTYSGGAILDPGSSNVFQLSSAGMPPTNGPVGTGTLILNGGSVRGTSGGHITNGTAVSFAADTTIPAGGSNLVFSGATTLTGTRTLTQSAGNAVTFSGSIGDGGGGFGLTKAGASTLVLSGANTYGGPTTNLAGALTIQHADALGTTAGDTTVAAGRLELQGGITVAGETIRITGDGGNTFGALQSKGGTNTWAGPVLVNAGNTRVGAQAGATLVISGSIQDGTQTSLIIRNEANGVTEFSGTNIYSGDTLVYNSTLRLGRANTLPASTVVRMGLAGVNGTLDLNGYNQVVAGVATGGGAVAASQTILNHGSVPAVLTVSNTADFFYSGILRDGATAALGLAKRGPGAQTLSGANTYSGGTEIDGGTLFVNGTIGAGAVTVAAGAALGGSGTVSGNVSTAAGGQLVPGASAGAVGTLALAGNLDLAGADTVRVDVAAGPSLDKIAVGGNLTPGGVTTIALEGSPGTLPPGTYPLIEVSGTLGGGTNNFALAVGRTRLLNYELRYDTSAPPQKVALDVTAGPGSAVLVWKGSADQWDIDGTPDWLNGPSDDVFFNDDFVTFDTTGVAQANVKLVGVLEPGSVIVDTSGGDYTFSSSSGGRISGASGLEKQGAGTLTVETDNDNTGRTVIAVGTLKIGAGGASGLLGRGPVTNDGVLAFDRAGELTVSNDIAGAGALVKQGPGGVTLTGNNSYGGETHILAGTLRAGNGGAAGSLGAGAVSNDGVLVFNRSDSFAFNNGISGAGSLVKAGAGILTSGVANGYAGATTISNGALLVGADGALGGAAAGTVVELNATLGLAGGVDYTAAEPLQVDGPGALSTNYFFAGSMVQRGALQALSGSNTWRGPISVRGTGINNRFGVQDGAQLTILGSITEMAPGVTVIFRSGGTAGSDVLVAGTNSSWTGDTQVFGGGGRVKLGAENALATGALLRIGTSNLPGDSLLDLNGYNQTVAGLNWVLADTAFILNDGGQPSTLTLSHANNQAFAGIIQDGLSKVSLVKRGPATQSMSASNTYSGSTALEEGTLALTGNGSIGNSTSILVAAGATLSAAGRADATLTLGAAQTLGGAGQVAGNLVNDGVVAPGSSPGVLTVSGNYTQSIGALNIDIGGPTLGVDYDALVVSNEAALGGALNVTFVNGYTGVAGHVFVVVNAASLSGDFTATNLPPLGGGNVWTNWVADGDYVLAIVNTAPLTGYDAWSNLYGLALGPTADSDGDGYANLLEYATGGNPTNADAVARLSAIRSNTLFAARLNRSTNATDVTLYVEAADTVANGAVWQPIATNQFGAWSGPANLVETTGIDPAVATVPDNATPVTNRFLRLRVTRP